MPLTCMTAFLFSSKWMLSDVPFWISRTVQGYSHRFRVSKWDGCTVDSIRLSETAGGLQAPGPARFHAGWQL